MANQNIQRIAKSADVGVRRFMRITIFLIFLLHISGCNEINSVDSDLILDANSISRAEKFYDKKELLSSLI